MFAGDLIEECLVSRENRRAAGRRWKQLYYTGSMSATPSKNNRCYSHVDKLTSYLFSPSDVHFTVEFDEDFRATWQDKKDRASRYVNDSFRRSGAGRIFGKAVEASLVEGCAIVKANWSPRGLEPWVIPQSFFGVLREDIEELDRQEAFVHSYYVTKAVFRRMLHQNPDRDEIMRLAQGSATMRGPDELTGDSYFHEIVAGGQIGQAGSGLRQAYGTVSVTLPQGPMLAAEVTADLIRVDDLWVWNDDLEDWTTIRYVAPGLVVEGRYRRRNLSDAPYRHPFIKVCSNEVTNYFWGRSELAAVLENQMVLNDRVDDVDLIFRLQARPPRSFSGFQGVTEERARALLMPGGTVTEGAMGATVNSLAPEMPAMAMEYLDKLGQYFDEAGGFTNILSGQGEPGVRAGIHAGVLLRTSTPRLRDRALLVEDQCAAFGTLALNIAQAKDATVLMTRSGNEDEKFMLSQLPEGARVTVDSHTSSPAFSEDNRQTAFALFNAQAIDGETLLQMIHPPREELLVERLRQAQETQAKMLQEHPELLDDKKKKK